VVGVNQIEDALELLALDGLLDARKGLHQFLYLLGSDLPTPVAVQPVEEPPGFILLEGQAHGFGEQREELFESEQGVHVHLIPHRLQFLQHLGVLTLHFIEQNGEVELLLQIA